jgi:hypothetical protein
VKNLVVSDETHARVVGLRRGGQSYGDVVSCAVDAWAAARGMAPLPDAWGDWFAAEVRRDGRCSAEATLARLFAELAELREAGKK